MENIIYNYSFGSEDGDYHIKVLSIEYELYKIIFEQLIFFGTPYKLSSNYEIINAETVIEKEYYHDVYYHDKYITTLNIKARNNPPPEKLFYYK